MHVALSAVVENLQEAHLVYHSDKATFSDQEHILNSINYFYDINRGQQTHTPAQLQNDFSTSTKLVFFHQKRESLWWSIKQITSVIHSLTQSVWEICELAWGRSTSMAIEYVLIFKSSVNTLSDNCHPRVEPP